MVEEGKKQFALKALLVSIDVSFPLTAYAVSTRYPGDFEPVDEQEYQETLENRRKSF